MTSVHERNLRGVLTLSRKEDRLFDALIIFIGTHVCTIDNDLTLADCQRALSGSSDGEIMKCVED